MRQDITTAWIRPCTRIWLFLIVLTLVALGIGQLNLNAHYLMLILLITTLWKGQLITDYFMALRHVRLLWRFLVWGWLLWVGAGVSLAYFITI
jgi:cytochrome c oxidase subunit IV